MKFLLHFALEVLAFDSFVAGGADAAIEFVVVMFAVRCVVNYVEGRGLERFRAGLAHEALLVIASCKASICRRHRPSLDWLPTSFAVSFRCCGTVHPLVLWGCPRVFCVA